MIWDDPVNNIFLTRSSHPSPSPVPALVPHRGSDGPWPALFGAFATARGWVKPSESRSFLGKYRRFIAVLLVWNVRYGCFIGVYLWKMGVLLMFYCFFATNPMMSSEKNEFSSGCRSPQLLTPLRWALFSTDAHEQVAGFEATCRASGQQGFTVVR